MIGNDVIDLAAAKKESNWQRKGFVEKLFSEQERQAIFAYAEPAIMVWVLWSMKEAAYKIYNRETGIRAYIPHRLHCTIITTAKDCFTGKVSIENFEYTTQTIVKEEAIHTVALGVEGTGYYEPDSTAVIKDAGLPYVRNNNTLYPASVSHHGRYHKIVALLK